MGRGRFYPRVSDDTKDRWRRLTAYMGARNTEEAMNLLLDLYEACSKRLGEKDIRRLVDRVKYGVFSVDI